MHLSAFGAFISVAVLAQVNLTNFPLCSSVQGPRTLPDIVNYQFIQSAVTKGFLNDLLHRLCGRLHQPSMTWLTFGRLTIPSVMRRTRYPGYEHGTPSSKSLSTLNDVSTTTGAPEPRARMGGSHHGPSSFCRSNVFRGDWWPPERRVSVTQSHVSETPGRSYCVHFTHLAIKCTGVMGVNSRPTSATFLTSGLPLCFRVFGRVWTLLTMIGRGLGRN